MHKELIEKRLKEIEQAIEQTLANFNMLEGGKRECLYWMDKLNSIADTN